MEPLAEKYFTAPALLRKDCNAATWCYGDDAYSSSFAYTRRIRLIVIIPATTHTNTILLPRLLLSQNYL